MKKVLELGPMTLAKFIVCLSLLGVLPCGAANSSASYRLRLYHLHTGEHIDVVYRDRRSVSAGGVSPNSITFCATTAPVTSRTTT